MRHSILIFAAAALAMACSDPKYSCSTKSDCPIGTSCDPAQKLCVIAGGCTSICKTNEACVAAVCVAQVCPTCIANQNCDPSTFKCVAVTDGTISLVAPAANGVLGGASAAVLARAGAPNGGPLHVDFTLMSSSGATLSTVSVPTGDPLGNYSGTLNLAGASTSTGNTLVATVFWKDATGATQQKSTGPATLTIDETPPSITGITTDQPYYSSVVGGSATVTATIADSGGSSGVKDSSVQLTVGTGTPVAGTLQASSINTYQFTVPLAGLPAGANSFTISASDAVNNTATQAGTLNVDNTPPVFGALSVPAAFFSGAALISPSITAAITDAVGSGVKPGSVQIKLDATHFISNDLFSGGTATWNSLTGASFLLPDGQQATVTFTFVATDNAGNPVESALQSIKIDRQGPAVGAVIAPTTYHACSGTVSVTAVVDDNNASGGSGAAGAALHVAGRPDTTGVFVSGSAAKTYSFAAASSVQAANTDTPVPFTITGLDAVANQTPAAQAATGNVLFDCAMPVVQSIGITGGTSVNGVVWFKQAASGNITVTANILERGSGVNATTLQLQATNKGSIRIDTGAGTVPPACGSPNALGVATCTFTVPLAFIASGNQQEYDFVVFGSDNVGNPVATGGLNTAKLGIDGLAPSVTFNIVTYSSAALPNGASGYYPAPAVGCNGGVADAALFCGHDGSHLWRKGETSSVITIATDTGGSGVVASSVTYSIAGSTNCTAGAPCPTTDAGSGNFTFVPDLSSATFTSGPEGTGTVSITVNAKDAVLNSSSKTFSTLQTTRVKWVRKTALLPIAGAPIYSAQLGALIAAGTSGGNPIVAIDTRAISGGSQLWSVGSGLSPPISTVTANMVLDTTASTNTAHPTPVLYVNSGNNLYAMHIGASGIDKYCTNTLNNTLTGSPVIMGGGATAAVIISGGYQVGALQTANLTSSGGACSFADLKAFGTMTARPTLGPPSANGNSLYFGFDDTEAGGSGDLTIKAVSFNGSFGTPSSTNIILVPAVSGTTMAAATPASDLFFGNDKKGFFYDYTTALALSHTSPALGATQTIFSQPTVSGGLVFGMTNQLIAYHSADLTSAWTALSSVTQVTPPAIGTNTLYLSEAATKTVHAIDTTTHTDVWTYTGGTTVPPTAISSLTTEPTLAPDGTLYFGDAGGRVYALITDTAPATTGATDWPRTGYDNCNSNHAANTGYTCQ